LNNAIHVTFTQDDPIPSLRVFLSGDPIFADDNIPILLLDGAIDPGMSGGPVVVNGAAIGVISGSLTKGGSGLAWAMPANLLKAVGQGGAFALDNLPPLALLVKGQTLQLRIAKKDSQIINSFAQAHQRAEELLASTGTIHRAVEVAKDSFPTAEELDAVESGKEELAVLGRKIKSADGALGGVVDSMGSAIDGPYAKSIASLKARAAKEQPLMRAGVCSRRETAFLAHLAASDVAHERFEKSLGEFQLATSDYKAAMHSRDAERADSVTRYERASTIAEKMQAQQAAVQSYTAAMRAAIEPWGRALACVEDVARAVEETVTEMSAALSVAEECRGYKSL
jgi:hypothetical protein